jgi:hypothetical protein
MVVIEMLSESEITEWLADINRAMQNTSISFGELQNLITEKRTLLKVLGKEVD